jgi:hypothetical protein
MSSYPSNLRHLECNFAAPPASSSLVRHFTNLMHHSGLCNQLASASRSLPSSPSPTTFLHWTCPGSVDTFLSRSIPFFQVAEIDVPSIHACGWSCPSPCRCSCALTLVLSTVFRSFCGPGPGVLAHRRGHLFIQRPYYTVLYGEYLHIVVVFCESSSAKYRAWRSTWSG